MYAFRFSIIAIFCGIFCVLGAFAQPPDAAFFKQADKFFGKFVENGLVNYAAINANTNDLEQLLLQIENMDITKADSLTQKAFYLNAYNLLVIGEVLLNYPLQSVKDLPGFFDGKRVLVGGERVTLNELEARIFKLFPDPRLHFVLICGAKGCPPSGKEAYMPEKLELQLRQQSRAALKNPDFVQINDAEKKVGISQIFEWYAHDFSPGGGNKGIKKYINAHRGTPLPDDYKLVFYPYDWSLNDVGKLANIGQLGNNAARYVVSAAIPKGQVEIKWFNNLYTQKTRNQPNDADFAQCSTFFTSSLSVVYGIGNRINLGFDARYRRVRYDEPPATALGVFAFKNNPQTRQGLTGLGPKLRIAPFPRLPDFSVQTAWWIPLRNDWAGTASKPYLDWNGHAWLTQFFNDFSIGGNFSLFAEVDVFLEDGGKKGKGRSNRFSTPLTAIFSYFPMRKLTLYGLANFAPYWSPKVDFFAQTGIGSKYQFTPKVELEFLYTYFFNSFLIENKGRAGTFNVGLRISAFKSK